MINFEDIEERDTGRKVCISGYRPLVLEASEHIEAPIAFDERHMIEVKVAVYTRAVAKPSDLGIASENCREGILEYIYGDTLKEVRHIDHLLHMDDIPEAKKETERLLTKMCKAMRRVRCCVSKGHETIMM
jgi:hypothetical protein